MYAHALPARLQAVKVNEFILASNKENRLTNKRGRSTEDIVLKQIRIHSRIVYWLVVGRRLQCHAYFAGDESLFFNVHYRNTNGHSY